jgi:hypothetical protein
MKQFELHWINESSVKCSLEVACAKGKIELYVTIDGFCLCNQSKRKPVSGYFELFLQNPN